MIMKRKYNIISILLLLVIFAASCKKEEVTTILKNDCIKRTLGPNVVGLQLEFAYAMALPASAGKLTSASVDATIAGATGTFLENRSFYTNSSGADVGITVGSASVTNTTNTTVTFTKDTCAATLRYYYVIPEEARGQSVNFTFSAVANNGEKVSYSMGPYAIANMEMKLDLVASDNILMYISIADMAVYNAATAAANPAKIDLVYLYRVITGITFAHALSSPASSIDYLPGITLPAGVTNRTKMVRTFGLRDQQLARLQYGVFIDDLDFQKIDFTGAPDYGINMKAEGGSWVETADGKYRAFVYVNSIDNTAKTMKISIKRLTMK
jgi:hypothetical protein